MDAIRKRFVLAGAGFLIAAGGFVARGEDVDRQGEDDRRHDPRGPQSLCGVDSKTARHQPHL